MTYLEEYAVAVLDGKINACYRIKQIYERLLNDLYHQDKYHFDEVEANRHIDFIETFCKQSQGKIGEPLKLELFQKAKFQAVFGFLDDNDCRRYNEVLTEEGRKNGKTSEMAAVSIDLLVNDREGAPEIYFIATARDQAKKGFDEAVRMVRQSSDLNDNILKRQTDLYFSANEGIIKPLASNTNSLDGLNSHGVIIDELSAIKNRDIYDLMKQSMSSRRNPLLFCITTNGFVRHGIYDAQHDYAVRVLDGMIEDEHFLPFLYGLDDRDEWADESAWIKANPGYGTIKQKSFLMSMVEKARVDETFRPTVLVKDFNVTENSSSAWLTWDEVDNDATTDLKFRYCVGGFDAADSVDLNAAKALMIRKDDPNIYVKSMYWLPESVLEQTGKTGSRHERDSVPYELWVKQGLLRTCPGNKCEKSIFLDWFCELREQGLYTL